MTPTDRPGWVDIKALSAQTGLSTRTLQRYMRMEHNPMPYQKPVGRVIVDVIAFRRWLSERTEANRALTGREVNGIVNEACEGL